MERAEILRKLMAQQNIKVADIVRITGIAYSTIKSMLENGIEKTSYVNVCKICEALGITTDQLEEMAQKKIEANHEPTYEDTKKLIARNGKTLSTEQRMELIKLLSEIKD